MAAKHRKSTKKRNANRNRRDTDRVVRWLQAGAVATGLGAAVISGQGVARATTDSDNDTNASDAAAPSAGDTATTPGVDSPAGDTDGSDGQTGTDGRRGPRLSGQREGRRHVAIGTLGVGAAVQ